MCYVVMQWVFFDTFLLINGCAEIWSTSPYLGCYIKKNPIILQEHPYKREKRVSRKVLLLHRVQLGNGLEFGRQDEEGKRASFKESCLITILREILRNTAV